ncbi:hypothetical protein SBC1_48250 (plasmid) [Caballeronia sp. SBC1]|uniref:DUF4148 domain-containing protein n=2 Tax=unclassified Caballeronia TaxID=2646786 RepID=UPI0013E1E809|nr:MULTISPECIES: DUF4148 domain-containing protein [unclassified Caballeronia]QIE25902.1 hypothetical protein SBC2_39720 [Caballeronia sp. SBC2]QIN64785.1 hypothetical protein SBC1_48250 [Caballeronia sp. SBC1]
MLKSILSAIVAAAAISAPVFSFAQSSQPVTRADVRADLVRVERAEINPGLTSDANYPADIQAAEARVTVEDPKNTTYQDVGGAPLEGSSSAGSRPHVQEQSSCVGPVSFCTLYFGS